MTNLLLRRNAPVSAYPDQFDVIMILGDGYELDVGRVHKEDGAHLKVFWAWSSPGRTGQAASREAAMAEIKETWSATDEDLAKMRQQQEWTANKYALWAAGYRDQLGKGPVKCRCGEMFNPSVHEDSMAHISHITGRMAGT